MAASQEDEPKECMKLQLQNSNEKNTIHRFYFVKSRPSSEEIIIEEADKRYHLMSIARRRINREINRLKKDEEQLNCKLLPFSWREYSIAWKVRVTRDLENRLHEADPHVPTNTVPRTSGFIRENADDRTIILDRKCCQKRLIKKGSVDVEYLKQVQEELLSSKKVCGMTSYGTQEIDDLIEIMTQSIKHGSTSRANEMKMYQEIRNVKKTREIYTVQEPSPKNYRYPNRPNPDTKWRRSLQQIINKRLYEIREMERDQMGYMRLKADLQHLRKKIISLKKELEDVNSKSVKAYKQSQELRKPKKDTISCYDEYKLTMTSAEKLAKAGDVMDLKQLCGTQVEGFMRQWSNNKAFRDNYERRKLLLK